MDADRFDSVARLIARRRSRRRVLTQTAAGLLAVAGVTRAAAQTVTPTSTATTSTTGGIAEAINAFRQANGLPPIPVSAALTNVAEAHVRDLMANHPEQVPGCNLHSWSDNGQWKATAISGAKGGCFTGRFTEAENHIMWDKPKEIAGYPGNGFENAYSTSGTATADDAVKAWVTPGDPHRDVILNEGVWASLTWKAIGGWVEDGFAVVWFGEEADTTAIVATTTTTGGPPPPAQSTSAPTSGGPPPPSQTEPAQTEPSPTSTAAGSECANGQSNCGNRCVDMTVDPDNCGACGNMCAADESCDMGVCMAAGCMNGETDCGNGCTDTNSDPDNCGACGNMCAMDEACDMGGCVTMGCADGQTDCGNGCVDTSVDPDNCGVCGNMCGADQACNNGSCE